MAYVQRGDMGLFYINAATQFEYIGTIVLAMFVKRYFNNIGFAVWGDSYYAIDGAISDFRIYNGSLLDSDISAQFNQKI